MVKSLTRAAILKEYAAVSGKLSNPSLRPDRRLVLVRRQADLGDLRDALAERERREAQS